MNFFTPAEIVKNYGAAGKKKAEMPLLKMLILGFLSGMFIAGSGGDQYGRTQH